jgi:hypothetical protein
MGIAFFEILITLDFSTFISIQDIYSYFSVPYVYFNMKKVILNHRTPLHNSRF